MPRIRTQPPVHPLAALIAFFVRAPLKDALTALETAQAIVHARQDGGLQEPVLPGTTAVTTRAPRPRRERTRTGPVAVPPPATAVPVHTPTPPVAVTPTDPATPPRRKRGRPRLDAASGVVPPGTVVTPTAPRGVPPLPEQPPIEELIDAGLIEAGE